MPLNTPDPAAQQNAPANAPKLLFVITEDWFFCSHFLPMARAAVAAGYHVGVAARFDKHREQIEALGISCFDLSFERGRLNPFGATTLIWRIFRLYRDLRPDLVHHISLKPVILGSLAARLARVPAMVNAITGFGFLFTAKDPKLNWLRRVVGLALNMTVGAPSSFVLLENQDDRQVLLDRRIASAERITVVGGAGVDPDNYPAMPLPYRAGKPVQVALIARMLWSKGIDLAVAAIAKARSNGCNVMLTLYGAPDPLNPAAISEAQLQEWSTEHGTNWAGKTATVVAAWQQADIALLPSRGGEGLPRSLIEAAACGRPIITTDVPGCREIVRHGETGLIVKPDDVDALARAIETLACDEAKRTAMAAASRAHFETRFTEEAVTSAVIKLYRQALSWALSTNRIDTVRLP